MEDYFKILNVKKGASHQEIKHAYRELVKQYHPDNFPQDEEFAKNQIIKICKAYSALTNKDSQDHLFEDELDFEKLFMNWYDDESFEKMLNEIFLKVFLDPSTSFEIKVDSQPIITDNIEEKLQKIKKFETSNLGVPEFEPIEDFYFDFDRLSPKQIMFYNYYKNIIRNQTFNELLVDVGWKYKTLFACEIICGYGVVNSDEGLQCLIDMKYEPDWIYSYWLTTDNSLTFEELNKFLLKNNMSPFKIHRTKLDESNLDDLFDFVTSAVSRTGYFYSSGAFCKKSEENIMLFKKCLIAVLDTLINIFHQHNKKFVDFVLHIKYKEELQSMYMFEQYLPFGGKFDYAIPLKEQVTGEYYWSENGKWYCNRPFINFPLCLFLVKSVENRLRKKAKIYRMLKVERDFSNYGGQRCDNRYNLAEVMSIEDFDEIITTVVDSVWNKCIEK